ncbi:Alpha N-terminal protein methyltransferase 1 [Agyrium rufum]|nr:Alpha N-terminal protein methyltransferase 1 [Agyrium rufum]
MADEGPEVSASAPDTHISHNEAIKYWNGVSPTVNGMLGGYPHISRIDLRGSASFLAKLRKASGHTEPKKLLARGVDCGAGIGRVMSGFLSKVCETVDIVEPVEKFAQEVRGAKPSGPGKVGTIYVSGLESWQPDEEYDLIWNQWCLGHLRDDQLVQYLRRSAAALAENGIIVVKENMSTDATGADKYDDIDNSVTRTDGKFRTLFQEAGLTISRTEIQNGFPKELYPVRMYALCPRLPTS